MVPQSFWEDVDPRCAVVRKVASDFQHNSFFNGFRNSHRGGCKFFKRIPIVFFSGRNAAGVLAVSANQKAEKPYYNHVVNPNINLCWKSVLLCFCFFGFPLALSMLSSKTMVCVFCCWLVSCTAKRVFFRFWLPSNDNMRFLKMFGCFLAKTFGFLCLFACFRSNTLGFLRFFGCFLTKAMVVLRCLCVFSQKRWFSLCVGCFLSTTLVFLRLSATGLACKSSEPTLGKPVFATKTFGEPKF